eukprot:CAMPEP_0116094710 /NCGR_PEP_ID=MMETSP0327-20121206/9278_1 /TAXON_ID=44447 /ORGANISM="Pseudo-nitzschia delicatissima, Strain B596" /LENGTH=386 /DNA_ID=CAMNT_0003586335 /DNA_START=244 /DNA_END=1404 /DNA_ORIENTATION=+
MNPRKRSKRMRAAFFAKLRYGQTHQNGISATEAEQKAYEHREALSDNLASLLQQERSGSYKCEDYLSRRNFELDIYDLLGRIRLNASADQEMPSQPQCPGDTQIDDYCREQIVEWSFRVVDYFHIDREVVVLSLSMLDRFLAICRCDRSTFKLAATTTLHVAVKLLHPCKLCELGILSDLSRGEFDMKDVALMEKHILESLNWKLHPPSSIAFCNILLDYFFSSDGFDMIPTDVEDLYDISSFFTELAVCDYYFVGLTQSTVAVASIINALEGMFGPDNKIAPRILSCAVKMNLHQHQDLSQTTHRLWELYERSEECALHNNLDPMDEEKTPDRVTQGNKDVFVTKATCGPDTGSPVSVSTTGNSMTASNEMMCAMRSQALRNGSW